MPVPDLGLGQPESSSKEGSAAPETTHDRAGAEDSAPEQESHGAGNTGADTDMTDPVEQPQAQPINQDAPILPPRQPSPDRTAPSSSTDRKSVV